ncbi:hypothetical protein RND81_06G144600 [Saponaria officinalis]|uniref:Uncharacterized protein n=1 Tax=Saponaria officinalis TaxID=3572 RepID=A0AAW1KD16_SAPOF
MQAFLDSASELTGFHNLLSERDNELGAAQSEIKALRTTDALKQKALEELQAKHDKLDEKLTITEHVIQQKNLEIKKLSNEKKEAVAAQFAAEAALRRLHATQKDDDSPPIEAIVAPLESDIKIYKSQIASLLEDNKALDRLTKSKEAALLETENILRSALERALIVEDIQNQNFDLRRRVEICQDENRILEKTNRQKVMEVEKLGQTIQQLEETVLAGGASANVVRDYKRQISELNEDKRILERELARAKVAANRVATVVANEWKDEHDKVMPVRQCLEERRLLQAEMQRLKDKLAVTERTAKAEAQLKDKFKLRLKTVEEGFKNAKLRHIGTPKSPNSHQILGFLSNHNTGPSFSSTSSPCHSKLVEHHVSAGNKTPRRFWPSKNVSEDHCGKENSKTTSNADMIDEMTNNSSSAGFKDMKIGEGNEDVVSGFLYDRLQKEVISLRLTCQAKDDGLSAKDDEIKTLQRKVDALSKSIEVEARKAKKEASAEHKVTVSAKKEDTKKLWSKSFLRRVSKSSKGSDEDGEFF